MTSSRRILLLRIIALVALLVSGALTADSFHTERGFCPLQAACKAARASALGRIAGVPTSVLGMLAFGGLLVLTFLPPRTARKVLRPIGLVAGLCGAGLLVYQAVVLKSFCPLCTVADGMGLAAGIVTLTWRAELAGRHARFARESVVGRLRWALAAATAVAIPLVWPQPAPRPAWVPVPEGVDDEVVVARAVPAPPAAGSPVTAVPATGATSPAPVAAAAVPPATPPPKPKPVVLPAPLPFEIPPPAVTRIPAPRTAPLPASFFRKSGVTATLTPTPRTATPPATASKPPRPTPTSPVPASPPREIVSVPLAPPPEPPPPLVIASVPLAPPPEPPPAASAGPAGPPPEPVGATPPDSTSPDSASLPISVSATASATAPSSTPPHTPSPAATPTPTPTPPSAPPTAATTPPAPTPAPPPVAAPSEVRLVEYLNAYCAHCRATHARLDKVIASTGIAVKRRRLYVWVSGEAPYWARACVAAAAQGKEDALFEELQRAESDDPDEVLTAARRAGIDAPALIAAIQRGEGMPRLKSDRQKVLGARLEGLPTFDVGRRRLEGEQSEVELEDALRAAATALAAR